MTKIWITLSNMFPEVVFQLSYASERLGLDCGIFKIKNGVITNVEESPKFPNSQDIPKYNQLASKIYYPHLSREDMECFDENWNVIDD